MRQSYHCVTETSFACTAASGTMLLPRSDLVIEMKCLSRQEPSLSMTACDVVMLGWCRRLPSQTCPSKFPHSGFRGVPSVTSGGNLHAGRWLTHSYVTIAIKVLRILWRQMLPILWRCTFEQMRACTCRVLSSGSYHDQCAARESKQWQSQSNRTCAACHVLPSIYIVYI